MSNGIYGYWDNVKHKVVYIGQSKNIEDRLNAHMRNSKYDVQEINKVIQNNPERYESFILADGDFTTDELNKLEYEAVEIFKTNRYKYPENEGFNFRDGGEVKEFSEETKKKISKKMGESRNTSGYLNVSKMKKKECKQGFIWRYFYYDETGKRKAIKNVSIKKLEEKVKSKGLKWMKL